MINDKLFIYYAVINTRYAMNRSAGVFACGSKNLLSFCAALFAPRPTSAAA
jgi:hypothetical protein